MAAAKARPPVVFDQTMSAPTMNPSVSPRSARMAGDFMAVAG
jgi:hypothetical protein